MRNVKGVLFADYIRMIRSHKETDWAARLRPMDLVFLKARIDPDGWYPMDAFERLGNAILTEIAKGNLEGARMWGRLSVDQLRMSSPNLICEGNATETLMRFRVLRSTYFDFEALRITTLVDDHAEILVSYHMGKTAEEAASYQTIGFFERLLDLAGATEVNAKFVERSWVGDSRTRIAISWKPSDA